jgi:hypothetical protein
MSDVCDEVRDGAGQGLIRAGLANVVSYSSIDERIQRSILLLSRRCEKEKVGKTWVVLEASFFLAS